MQDANRCVLPAYRSEIEGIKKGPLALLSNKSEINARITDLVMEDFKAKRPYVDKILRYVAQNTPVFLVVDNVDQIDPADKQAAIFVDAMAIAQKNKLNAIIAMRDATYVQQKNLAVFNAYEFDNMYIDPPKILSVISRRFLIAREMLRGKPGDFIAENGAHIIVKDKATIVDLVQGSVLGSEVGKLIEVLATGDVRLATRMCREFLQSGYTATGKALQIYMTSGKYQLPTHEAIRSIMLGSRPIYEEAYSVLGNPFDARLSRTRAQLLRLYILSAIVTMSSRGDFRHLDGEEIVDSLRHIGFGDEITDKVLKDMCQLRFIETESRGEPDLRARFLATRLGGYVIKEFLATFVFLENVMMDTFIPIEEYWKEIRSLSERIYDERNPAIRFALRKQRVTTFFDSMHKLYEPLYEESVRRGFSADWCQDPFASAKDKLEKNLSRAMRSAIRHYA